MDSRYFAPESIMEWMDEAATLQYLRDVYATRWFHHRKARRCGMRAVALRRKFWKTIYEIYPELDGYELTYRSATGEILVLSPGDSNVSVFPPRDSSGDGDTDEDA